MWHKSIGIIKYGPEIKAVLLADQEIANFYRSMLPKWIQTNPQKHPAHISFIRREIPPNMNFWRKYEGERVEFEYNIEVEHDETYYWLPAKCKRLEEIRIELGLANFPWWRNGYHITIGNVKGLKEDD